uniref:Cytochrome c oxidase assembly factor 6 homolog n=2 Tax=Leptobrachium leishanense TaxID=445787 RepID=A0A8C5MWG5_9ANUR
MASPSSRTQGRKVLMAAPTAKERKACWDARDHYWKCLDDNSDDNSKCQQLRHCFESNCPQQWIKHLHDAWKAKTIFTMVTQRHCSRPSPDMVLSI